MAAYYRSGFFDKQRGERDPTNPKNRQRKSKKERENG